MMELAEKGILDFEHGGPPRPLNDAERQAQLLAPIEEEKNREFKGEIHESFEIEDGYSLVSGSVKEPSQGSIARSVDQRPQLIGDASDPRP